MRGWQDADESEGVDVTPDPFIDFMAKQAAASLEVAELKANWGTALLKAWNRLQHDTLHDTIQEQWPW